MPRGDGTGPGGMGPMTGRAAGFCAGFPVPGYANPVGGRGMGMGWGRGFRGGGFGRGFGWGRAGYGLPAYGGAVNPYAYGGAVNPYAYGGAPCRLPQQLRLSKSWIVSKVRQSILRIALTESKSV